MQRYDGFALIAKMLLLYNITKYINLLLNILAHIILFLLGRRTRTILQLEWVGGGVFFVHHFVQIVPGAHCAQLSTFPVLPKTKDAGLQVLLYSPCTQASDVL